MNNSIKHIIKALMPPIIINFLQIIRIRLRRIFSSPNAFMNSVEPISKTFGTERGTPVDRYYIEKFLKKYSGDIKGTVLETGRPQYISMFSERIQKFEILNVLPGDDCTTIVGDFATGFGIPEKHFDCLVLTQVFPFIYDIKSAIKNCHKSLKDGGIMLVTLPGISQISRYDMDRWGDYWRFTDASAKKLFSETFGSENCRIETYGNVFSASALLYGLASEEILNDKLDYNDSDYQIIITVRAVKT